MRVCAWGVSFNEGTTNIGACRYALSRFLHAFWLCSGREGEREEEKKGGKKLLLCEYFPLFLFLFFVCGRLLSRGFHKTTDSCLFFLSHMRLWFASRSTMMLYFGLQVLLFISTSQQHPVFRDLHDLFHTLSPFCLVSPFPPEYSLCLFVVFHWLRAFHLSSSLFSTPPTAQIKRRFLCHTTQGVVPHSLSCSSYSSFCDSSRSSLSPPIIPRCHPDPQTYNPPFRFLCVPLRPPRTSRPSWAESHRQRQAAAAPRAGGRVGCLPPTVFFFFFFFYKRGDGWQKTRQKATQHYCSPILRRFAFSGEASGSTS